MARKPLKIVSHGVTIPDHSSEDGGRRANPGDSFPVITFNRGTTRYRVFHDGKNDVDGGCIRIVQSFPSELHGMWIHNFVDISATDAKRLIVELASYFEAQEQR